jgi:hypothetical protein
MTMKKLFAGSMMLLAVVCAPKVDAGGSKVVNAPIVCTKGDANQKMWALLTLPASAAVGSKFTVRIEGVDSGVISHTGLNYIYNMESDYPLPAGAKYVAGSAKFLPNTGTANVRPGATAWQDATGIHTRLPGHVANGTSFSPPTLEYQLEVTGKVGDILNIGFSQYRVTANAMVIGDVNSTCDPTPKPYKLGSVTITAAAP